MTRYCYFILLGEQYLHSWCRVYRYISHMDYNAICQLLSYWTSILFQHLIKTQSTEHHVVGIWQFVWASALLRVYTYKVFILCKEILIPIVLKTIRGSFSLNFWCPCLSFAFVHFFTDCFKVNLYRSTM